MPQDQSWSQRAIALRKACDYGGRGGSKAFAEHLGLTSQRWSQMETGYSPLSIDIACKIVAKYPDLTLDWLILGRPDGLPLMWRRLLGLI
jgi:hypothetical protein